MKFRLLSYIVGMSLIGVATACDSDMDEPSPIETNETSIVDLDLSFGSDWTVDLGDASRAAPGGAGGNNTDTKVDGEADIADVDMVRVIGFKRREGQTSSFVYDIVNDIEIPIEPEPVPASDGKPTGHKHKVAHGKFKKTYGFEYKAIAVAYSSDKDNLYSKAELAKESTFSMPDGEQNWFNINTAAEPTFEGLVAQINSVFISKNVDQTGWRDLIKGSPSYSLLDIETYEKNVKSLSRNVVQVPQLFYGTLSSIKDSDIIGYSETDSDGNLTKDLPLSGILYRGVAKLEMDIKPYFKKGSLFSSDTYIKWVAIMADQAQTQVGLTSYDDFLKPSKAGINDGYTVVQYLTFSEDDCKNNRKQSVTAWFLPCMTKLALRIKDSNDNIYNYQIVTSGSIVSSGNGTGIISPDVVDGVFYLRRNHKYTITEIDLEKLMNSSHELK